MYANKLANISTTGKIPSTMYCRTVSQYRTHVILYARDLTLLTLSPRKTDLRVSCQLSTTLVH